MSKYFQAGITLLYILLTGVSFLVLVALLGVHINKALGPSLIIAWVLICFLVGYIRAYLSFIVRSDTRKPIWSEEEKLRGCFNEVLQKAGCSAQFDLLIHEDMELNAFATGLKTIVVSRGSLEQMTNGELKAILAHELGHLLSRDCIILSAFGTAKQVSGMVKPVFHGIMRILIGRIRSRPLSILEIIELIISKGLRLLIRLAVFIIVLSLPGVRNFIMPFFAVFAFTLLFTLFYRVFNFFHLIISRFIEYRQDAFAWTLGYGPELRQALVKIVSTGPQSVNLFTIITKGSHPVIYNRIRRLEKLEGIRDKD